MAAFFVREADEKTGYKSGGNMGRRDEEISCGNRNPTGYDGESDTPWQKIGDDRYRDAGEDIGSVPGTNGTENGGHENGAEGENPSVPVCRSDRRHISGNYPPVKNRRQYMSVNLIFKIAAVGILVSVLSQVLKHSGREEHAFLTSLAGLLLVLYWLVPIIVNLFENMKKLFDF